MSGTLIYWVKDGENTMRSLKLTVCAEDDRPGNGLAAMRRKRLKRILHEALRQGARLSYRDLSIIMLSSKATLKRDISHLRNLGMNMPLRGRQALQR
jgi:Fic family protein